MRKGRAPRHSDTLVELKALGITPEFARSMAARNGRVPPVSELVEMKLFGRAMRR